MSVLRPQRRLFLHLSALSDAEYAVYVDALRDLLDDGSLAAKLPDDELERKQVGVREVRAWMKGRFRDLSAGEIDKVLQLFAPQTVHKELSGGQLLAALRLLMHARRGGDVNEGGVFVQADPSSPSSSRFTLPFSTSSATAEASFPTPDVPITVLNTTGKTRTNPFSPDPQLQDIKGHDSTHSISLSSATSPFLATSPSHPPPAIPSKSSKSDLPSPRRASLSSAPPIPPASSKPHVEGVGESGVRPGTTNPFLQRAKTHSGAIQSGRTPPLPPRKPAHISNRNATNPPPPVPLKPSFPAAAPPEVQANVSGNSGSSSSTSNQLNSGTPSPPLLPHHRVTPLMQQSLLASRAGAMLKRAQGEAERTRVLEVIRSSNGAHKQTRTPSTSRSPDKGERRPVPRPPRSAPSSASIYSSYSTQSGYSDARSTNSLEQVAGARLVSRNRTRSPDHISSRSSSTASSANEEDVSPDSAKKMSLSEQFSAPPTHPARRPSGHTPTRPRHVRTPSLQSYHTATPGTPFSASATSPFHVSNSSPPVSPMPSNNNTNVARTMRSLSMHQSSSPTFSVAAAAASEQTGRISPPLPPPRRRRPDSVQVTPRASAFDTNPVPGSPFTNAFTAALERHSNRLDLDKDKSRDFRDRDADREKERSQPHALASLQRTFNSLQARAQPTLARARYKAEAGLAPRRGFVPNGRDYNLAGEAGDRLVGGDDASAGMDPDYEYGGGISPDDDGELGAGWGDVGDDGEETIRGRGRGRGRLAAAHERDNLKLPEGEGWAPL
ncbi:hypothetical protein M0805_003207 [Coniferiporia weirii]|nr:hypothetical protein M0805_003207 [Coniferiporia weirii]